MKIARSGAYRWQELDVKLMDAAKPIASGASVRKCSLRGYCADAGEFLWGMWRETIAMEIIRSIQSISENIDGIGIIDYVEESKKAELDRRFEELAGFTISMETKYYPWVVINCINHITKLTEAHNIPSEFEFITQLREIKNIRTHSISLKRKDLLDERGMDLLRCGVCILHKLVFQVSRVGKAYSAPLQPALIEALRPE